MAKLILNPTSSSRREIRLHRTLLSIGRDPGNDLVLPDAMVSRRHAVIEYRGTQYFLRDCNSSNGSVVNGDRVSERSLRDGDLLAIGTARLLFREEAQVEDPAAKVVPHPSVPRLQCPSCQAEYRRGDLFCRECGAQVAVPSGPPKAVCASCGTAVLLPARFCAACGAPLDPDGESREATKPHPSLERGASEPPPPPPKEAGPEPPPEPPPSVEAVPSEPPTDKTPAPRVEAAEKDAAPLAAPSPARSGGSVTEPLRVAAPSAAAAPAVPLPRRRSVEKPAERTAPPPERRPLRPTASVPAGLGRRLAAGLVDAGALAIGQAALLAPVVYYWSDQGTQARPADVPFLPILLSVSLVPVAALLGLAYFAYFWGFRGATPGKRLFGLVVESEKGEVPIGVSRALLRLFGYALSGATLGIGFLMIARDGLGLHDRIAGTRVVRRRGE